MAARTLPDDQQRPLERRSYPHSEWLNGTKEQIQRTGVGVGVPFPGEPGAQPRQITVRDPKGRKARIRPAVPRDDGRYEVHIELESCDTTRRGPRSPMTVTETQHSVMYQGTREQLISQAGAKPEWFDGIGAKINSRPNSKTRRQVQFVVEGRKIALRQSSGPYFLLYYGRSEEEQQAYDARREIEKKREAAERKIADWPSSFDAFRRHVDIASDFAFRLLDVVPRGVDTGGYSMDENTIDEIAVHAAAIHAAIAAADVRFDPKVRAAESAQLLGAALAGDAGFTAFMGRLRGGGKG